MEIFSRPLAMFNECPDTLQVPKATAQVVGCVGSNAA